MPFTLRVALGAWLKMDKTQTKPTSLMRAAVPEVRELFLKQVADVFATASAEIALALRQTNKKSQSL